MARRDTLDESLRHLDYEMAMMVATPRMLAQYQLTPANNTVRADGYYWANDRAVAYLAAMESALVHARLLNDFFKYGTGDLPTSGFKASDRYAAEYCTTKGWSGSVVLTKSEHTIVDKQLSHFTTERSPRRTHDLGRFAQRAVDALIKLTSRANAEWQDPLLSILARCEAESKRSLEVWTPALSQHSARPAPGRRWPC